MASKHAFSVQNILYIKSRNRLDSTTVDKLTFIYTNTRSLQRDRVVKAANGAINKTLEEVIFGSDEVEALGMEEDQLIPAVLGKRKRIEEEEIETEVPGIESRAF